MTSKPEYQQEPLSPLAGDPALHRQQQEAMQNQQRQLEQQRRKPKGEDELLVTTMPDGPMIFTVEKGANTVPDFGFFRAFTSKTARLRNMITEVVKSDPELEAVVNEVALSQPSKPSSAEVQTNLYERVLAIIEKRPDLKGYFED